MGTMASQISSLTIGEPFIQPPIEGNIKPRVTGLSVGNSPVTGEFPAQMASNAENVFIWWRYHVKPWYLCIEISDGSEIWQTSWTHDIRGL